MQITRRFRLSPRSSTRKYSRWIEYFIVILSYRRMRFNTWQVNNGFPQGEIIEHASIHAVDGPSLRVKTLQNYKIQKREDASFYASVDLSCKQREFFVPIAKKLSSIHTSCHFAIENMHARSDSQRTDISSRKYWRAWEERHGTIGRGKPRRLAVIRQANHPRPRYLNGHRYVVTSQLPYCLYAASLITPIGSYCLAWRRISDPVSMGPSQWARCASQLPTTVRYIAKTRSLCARIGSLVARATWVALHRRVVHRHRICPISRGSLPILRSTYSRQ